MDESYPLGGKIYWKIPVRAVSPVIVGSGESEKSDLDVLRDPEAFLGNPAGEAPPVIPATSIIGVFRHYLEDRMRNRWSEEEKCNFYYLFGDVEGVEDRRKKTSIKQLRKRYPQSALQCRDAVLSGAKLLLRDSVRIDPKTNTAAEGAKFNYEAVLLDQPFDLFLEINLRKKVTANGFESVCNPEIIKRFIDTLIAGLMNSRIRLGAKTNKGFGRLKVKREDVRMLYLDFSNPEHVWQWLNGKIDYPKESPADFTPYEIKEKAFVIDAYFRLNSSLLIRSYSTRPEAPDTVALENDGTPVLSGTSAMGAIRHRALRILNTLGCKDAQDRLEQLFGFVREHDRKHPARKGKVRIEEKPVRNWVKEVQTRIKIDRFTGGTIQGALFESMPVWQKGNQDAVNLRITIHDYEDWEAGLFLFILKDLWTGDLAIGGDKAIGRGVFSGTNSAQKGSAARVKWNGGEICLRADEETGNPILDKEGWNKLNAFASKLQTL